MKKGDTVYYLDYRMGGRMQFFQGRVTDWTASDVTVSIEEIIFDDKSGPVWKEGNEYILPKKPVYTKETLPRQKLIKWLFIVGIEQW